MAARCFNNNWSFKADGNLIKFDGPVSWACWVRVWSTGSGTDDTFFGKTGEFSFSRQQAGGFFYSVVSNGGTSYFRNGATPTLGKWTHLASAWNPGSYLNLFVDGVYQGGATVGSTLHTGTTNSIVVLGDADAEVAHCAVWSAVLYDRELEMLWQNDPRRVRPGALRAYWPLVRDANAYRGYQAMYVASSTGHDIILDDSNPPNQILEPAPMPMSVGLRAVGASVPMATVIEN